MTPKNSNLMWHSPVRLLLFKLINYADAVKVIEFRPYEKSLALPDNCNKEAAALSSLTSKLPAAEMILLISLINGLRLP